MSTYAGKEALFDPYYIFKVFLVFDKAGLYVFRCLRAKLERRTWLPILLSSSSLEDGPLIPNRRKCYTNLETGDKFGSKDELLCFIDDAEKETVFKKCHKKLETGDKGFAKEALNGFANNERRKKKSPNKVVLCCTICGKVGDLTSCCSLSIRKSDLRSVTRKLKSKRIHFGERGHDHRIPKDWILAPKKRRIIHCSLCARPRQNRRTCPKGV